MYIVDVYPKNSKLPFTQYFNTYTEARDYVEERVPSRKYSAFIYNDAACDACGSHYTQVVYKIEVE